MNKPLNLLKKENKETQELVTKLKSKSPKHTPHHRAGQNTIKLTDSPDILC